MSTEFTSQLCFLHKLLSCSLPILSKIHDLYMCVCVCTYIQVFKWSKFSSFIVAYMCIHLGLIIWDWITYQKALWRRLIFPLLTAINFLYLFTCGWDLVRFSSSKLACELVSTLWKTCLGNHTGEISCVQLICYK